MTIFKKEANHAKKKLTVHYPKAAIDVQGVIDPLSLFPVANLFHFDNDLGDLHVQSNYSFPSVLDGDPIIKTFDNLTIDTGKILTVTNRCKGLYLYIKGNLVINGTISMTARGAKGPGKYVIIDYKKNPRIFFADANTNPTEILEVYNKNQVIYPTGGKGVLTGNGKGINGACGSGGANYEKTRRGGHGTSFSGGAGAGGSLTRTAGTKLYGIMEVNSIPTQQSPYVPAAGTYNANGADEGGLGGAGSLYTNSDATIKVASGSGAGNPSGEAFNGYIGSGGRNSTIAGKGVNGTGGLIILIVEGNIEGTGSIEAKGCKGGDGGYSGYQGFTVAPWFMGGAGSGGGAIHVFHKGELTSTVSFNVTGGSAGLTRKPNQKTTDVLETSYAGGAGSINIVKI